MSTCSDSIQPDNNVTRDIEIEPTSRLVVDTAVARIAALNGMSSVRYKPDDAKLEFSYDPCHLNIDQIVGELNTNGIAIRKNWWSRIKRDYYEFEDSNIRLSADQKTWSCHANFPTSNQYAKTRHR